MLAPAQVAEVLNVSVDEVIALVIDGSIRGVRVGVPPQWRVEQSSLAAYLDDRAEEVRRMALWEQSNAASFPELWGTGVIRNPD
ncbi:helix-turn-helix domain-containing protein [Microbacterium rhizomatis]|uniref:Helix-turn-helix domain-containing protein n=2 Tax=Microbacterium rhizomatis TaxID=1631477 RepID=A0A5J5J6I7_9MICO|nr:helix-turn-helix domain-containing protein [Microbacterium rhizomatis]